LRFTRLSGDGLPRWVALAEPLIAAECSANLEPLIYISLRAQLEVRSRK